MRVAIYQDYIHNHGILHRALTQHFGAPPAYLDAADIIEGGLRVIDLLVMPGGADLYYCEKLNGAGNAAIRAFVEQGGTYLGICAGAYYACASIDWAAGTEQAIAGPRELCFFNGEAIGPFLNVIEGGSIDGNWDGVVTLSYNDGTRRIAGDVLYSGGPAFTGAHPQAVLARYADGTAAIVECSIGRGKALLVGPHLEGNGSERKNVIYRHRNKSFVWQTGIAANLAQRPEPARQIWSAILDRCKAAA